VPLEADPLSTALYGGAVRTTRPATLMRNDAFSYAVVVPDGFVLSGLR
jgi:hypothetical protein